MTDQVHTITEDQLHAYVDGQLDEAARYAVERFLAQNAEAAARVRSWQTLNQGLQQLASGLGAAPGRVLEWKHGGDELSAHRTRRVTVTLFLRIAAAAAMVAIGVVGGWIARDARGPTVAPITAQAQPGFVQQAAVAYKVFASPVQARPVEITGEERDRLQRWLSGKMGLNFGMQVPQLEQHGWKLLGGRMLADSQGPAALYVYEDGKKNRLALYVLALPDDAKMGLTWTPSGDATIADWGYNRLHMALAGDVTPEQMKALLGPINQQIVAGTAQAPALGAIPELPVPQITVSLNTQR